MNFIEKIKLAFYNLTHRKKTTAQCVAMMSFIMLLVFLASFFIATLTIQLNDSLDNYASKNYIDIRHYGLWLDDENIQVDNVMLDQDMQTKLRAKFNSVGDINYYKIPDPGTIYIPTFTNLIVDGITYESTIKPDSDINYFDSMIIVKEINVPTFSNNMRTEFSKKFPNENLIKYGRDIENDNELLLPEEYLTIFDVTPEQLFSAESVTIENIFFNAKIVGITNGNIVMMYPDKNGNRNPNEYIVIYSGADVLFYSLMLIINPETGFLSIEYMPSKDSLETFQRIELKNSTEVENILEYFRDVFGEDYSIRYANQSNLDKLDTINKILTFVWDIIVVLFLVLGLGLIVFLYSVMEHSAKQKGTYYGMMRAMGQKNTLSITLIETVIMTLFAAAICLIISSIAVFAMSGAVIYISWSSYEFSVSINLFILVFIITLIIVVLLNILIAFLSSKRQNSKSITTALRN